MYLATSQAAIYHKLLPGHRIIGLIQGFFELFPLSSLGHTVLIPSWIGGSWATLVRQESLAESPYRSVHRRAPPRQRGRPASFQP